MSKEDVLSLVDYAFDEIDPKSCSHAQLDIARRAIKEAIHAITTTTDNGDKQVQTSLFGEKEAKALLGKKPLVYEFEFFWKHYPKKVGKQKAINFWRIEAKKPQTSLMIWNALYIYAKEIRDSRRKGFNRVWRDGDRFLRNYLDWIGYQDQLIPDIDQVIEKTQRVLKQIDEEEHICQHLPVAARQTVDLQSEYKGDW